MRHAISVPRLAVALILASTSPPWITAQDRDHRNQPRYRLVDVGTLGGPNSFVAPFNNNLNKDRPLLTNCADTAQLNPDFPDDNPFLNSRHIQHGYRWSSGRLTDLGSLRRGTSSCGQGINVFGSVAG